MTPTGSPPTTPLEIGPDRTVNDVSRAYPATLAVFARHGIDSCCGGALPLAEVARRHHLELPALLAELARAAGTR